VTEVPRLSVIIPCRDDAGPLARLLPQFSAEDGVELIVVSDSDRHDEVTSVCASNGAQCVILNEPRGVRLRKGAELASAPNFWFLHADSEISDDAVRAIMQAFSDGHMGGYFRFRLLGPRSLRKRLIEYSVAQRCKFGGIPYGDQALFVTAAEYERAGGHEPLPLFDEFRLVRQLMRSDRFHLLPLSVGVDARRWEKKSFILHSVKNRLYSLAFTLGVSPSRLARWYHNR
jgi:glycosyltransferase involved in cell wall biosynthesis